MNRHPVSALASGSDRANFTPSPSRARAPALSLSVRSRLDLLGPRSRSLSEMATGASELKHRALRPARSFNILGNDAPTNRPSPREKPQHRSTRTRQDSNEAGSESSHHAPGDAGTAMFDEDDLVEAYARLHENTTFGQITTAFPKPHSRSLPSSPSVSSTASSFELNNSPAPSPFFAPPPASSFAPSTMLHDKENISSRRADVANRVGAPRKLELRSQPSVSVAKPSDRSPEPRSANAVLQHVRVKAGATTFGFPFASSILATSESFADLRSPAGRTSVRDAAATGGHARAGASGGSKGSDSSHRLSSDVDLELSFDYHDEEPEMSVEEEASIESVTAAWIGIDMTDQPVEHDVPEGELVRSPSGRLVGTNKKRVRSAVDLRAQFRSDAESIAIQMDDDPARVPELARQHESNLAWVRTGGEQTVSPVGLPGRRVPAPIKTTRPSSMGQGFAYNPTDPLNIPLPDSPLTSAAPSPSLRIEARSFPLPLRLLERARKSPATQSPLSSPDLVSTTIDTKGKGKEERQEQVIDLHHFIQEEEVLARTSTDRRQNWATQLAQSALARWTSTSSGAAVANRQRTNTNETQSPGAKSLFEQPEHSSSSETFDTAQTTPILDGHSEDEQVAGPSASTGAGMARSPKQAGGLSGLGIAFDPTSEETDDDERVGPLPMSSSARNDKGKGKGKAVATPARLTSHHRAIPSLSITRPIEDGHETSSVTSNDSAVDPTVSPSRRISRRLSGIREPTDEMGSTTATATRRAQFGPGSHHLLVSETMPRARLPHQTSLDSTRFSFTPAPLELVKAHFLRAAGYDTGNATMSTTGAVDHRRYRHSMISLIDLTASAPGQFIETTVPSKLLFLAGFLLGPWCWILGGWWVRPVDGELRKTRGVRCRSEGCHCGMIIQGGHLLGTARRHGGGTSTTKMDAGVMEEERWMGLDSWVFVNRVLAIGSGVGVGVIVAVALWEAVLAA